MATRRATTKLSQEDLETIASFMGKKNDKEEGDNNLVKIVIGIVVSLVTASLIFLATNTYSTNSQLTQLATNMTYVAGNVDGLTKKMDAIQATYATQAMVNEVKVQDKTRADDLDTRIRSIEFSRKK